MMRLNRRIIFLYGGVILFFVFLIHALSRYGDYAPKAPGNIIDDQHAQLKEELGDTGEKDTCYYDSQCPSPHILFRLHAETLDHPPFGCLNDIQLFHNNVSVGINVISLNGTTGDILESHTFDVTTSDGKLMTWLRSLPEYAIVVGVSFGDIAERVSRDARETFHVFGATKVDGWKSGNSYSIIGQRGLKGHAFEQIMSLTSQGQGHLFEGCFDLPIGDIGTVNITETVSDAQNINRLDEDRLAQLQQAEGKRHFKVILGKTLENCGMKEACKKDEIAMSFFSGEHKDDFPKVCVGGQMVFDKDLNEAGRGLNIFALEPKTAKVRLVANFDTYEDDSPALEDFLDSIPNGDIVAAVSFDEASTALSEMAKQIFYELGSSQVHRLKFRASWYFVGQKGIKAYTPFEDLIYPMGNNWAKPVSTAICVPKSLSKWSGRMADADPTVKNIPKRHFCAKYDKYDEFCSATSIDKPIAPRSLSDIGRSSDKIYNTPIIVVAGLSTTGLQRCLESLMDQEGLNTQMVLVVYDRDYGEKAELATLFHAKSLAVNISDNFDGLLFEAVNSAFHLFPSAPAVAVIEQDFVPTGNWLKFFEQTLPTLLKDETVDIVQALNVYGYHLTSARPSVVYRVDFHPPRGSYLLSRRFYEKNVQNKNECCNPNAWNLTSSSALVPEISRITVEEESAAPEVREELSSRTFSNSSSIPLKGDFLTVNDYEAELRRLYSEAEKMAVDRIDCQFIAAPINTTSPIAIRLATIDLHAALKCFSLRIQPNSIPYVLPTYKGVFRMFHSNTDYLFIAKNSSLLV